MAQFVRRSLLQPVRPARARLAVGPSQLGPRPTRLISTSTRVTASASTTIPPGVRLDKLKGSAASVAQAAASKTKSPATAPKAGPKPAKAQSKLQPSPNHPKGGTAKFVELANQDWCTLPSYVNKLKPSPSPASTVDRHKQLAFVGDGLLEYATRQIWFEVHPNGTSHAPTVLRNALVSGEALAPLSRQVGLPVHLRSATPAQAKVSRTQAELFEAYVAQFAKEKGFTAVYEWLSKLYIPLVRSLPSQPTRTARSGGHPRAFTWLETYASAIGEEVKVDKSSRGQGAEETTVCTTTLGKIKAQVEVRPTLNPLAVAAEQVWEILGQPAPAQVAQKQIAVVKPHSKLIESGPLLAALGSPPLPTLPLPSPSRPLQPTPTQAPDPKSFTRLRLHAESLSKTIAVSKASQGRSSKKIRTCTLKLLGLTCSGQAKSWEQAKQTAAQKLWDLLPPTLQADQPARPAAAGQPAPAPPKAAAELDPRVRLETLVRARKMVCKAVFEVRGRKSGRQALCKLSVGEYVCQADGAGKGAAKKA